MAEIIVTNLTAQTFCHILLTVVPFGAAVSRKTLTDWRDYTRVSLNTCLMTSPMDIGYSWSGTGRKQGMLWIIFKALKKSFLQYSQSLLNVRENNKTLRGKNKLVLSVAKTTTYDLKLASCIAGKAWNALSEFGPFQEWDEKAKKPIILYHSLYFFNLS